MSQQVIRDRWQVTSREWMLGSIPERVLISDARRVTVLISTPAVAIIDDLLVYFGEISGTTNNYHRGWQGPVTFTYRDYGGLMQLDWWLACATPAPFTVTDVLLLE